MKKTLIQTQMCSIVYGNFQEEKNQELFRCPRATEHVDLRRYVNENYCLLGIENNNETKNLHEIPGYIGYYRMYFRDFHWHGRWMEYNGDIDKLICLGIDEIIDWICEKFPRGCDWDMKEFLSDFPNWGTDNNRYLLKPIYSDRYKIMIDTTYGNGDYPIRIYVYEPQNSQCIATAH